MARGLERCRFNLESLPIIRAPSLRVPPSNRRPSLYMQRFAFWDTQLNAILVDRTWACAGELSWNAALAAVFLRLDRELTGGTAWVRALTAAMFLTYVVAECMSYYNTATTNQLWGAAEVATDAASQLLLLPAALRLLAAVPRGRRCGSAGVFLANRRLSLFAIGLSLYNFWVGVPMYLRRYREDQRRGKRYLPFAAGLRDAWSRRVPTRAYEDWRGDIRAVDGAVLRRQPARLPARCRVGAERRRGRRPLGAGRGRGRAAVGGRGGSCGGRFRGRGALGSGAGPGNGVEVPAVRSLAQWSIILLAGGAEMPCCSGPCESPEIRRR
ncbi:unnamed protein product, partial [Prorocentrum cordatum]